jgi:hypothetical protein
MSVSEPLLSEFLTREQLAAELRRTARTLDRWAALGIARRWGAATHELPRTIASGES